MSAHDCFFFFQAEDGIRDLVRSRGLGDVYKRQGGDVRVAPKLDGLLRAKQAPARALLRLRWRALRLSLIHI